MAVFQRSIRNFFEHFEGFSEHGIFHCPSRKSVHFEILDLFRERGQSRIFCRQSCQGESRAMRTLTVALAAFVSTLFCSRRALQLENVALRHQMTVNQRTTKRYCQLDAESARLHACMMSVSYTMDTDFLQPSSVRPSGYTIDSA